MGSRTDQTVKEIDTRRASLEETLAELEKRLPPLAGAARRAVALALGGGAGGGVLLLALRRALKHRRTSTSEPAAQPQVVVKVLPGGAVAGAVVIAAIWGIARAADAWARARSGSTASVTSLPSRAERGA